MCVCVCVSVCVCVCVCVCVWFASLFYLLLTLYSFRNFSVLLTCFDKRKNIHSAPGKRLLGIIVRRHRFGFTKSHLLSRVSFLGAHARMNAFVLPFVRPCCLALGRLRRNHISYRSPSLLTIFGNIEVGIRWSKSSARTTNDFKRQKEDFKSDTLLNR